jgi:hypothetical protein
LAEIAGIDGFAWFDTSGWLEGELGNDNPDTYQFAGGGGLLGGGRIFLKIRFSACRVRETHQPGSL